jgi:hypothetical protein
MDVSTGLGVALAVGLAIGAVVLAGSRPALSFGRALRIRNRKQLPAASKGSGWSGEAVALQMPLSDTERAALGELWLEMARAEHASVPAFSQLGLQLSALGAPAPLLIATHRAALEEIEHARRCFAIASAIRGAPCTAGAIPALAYARPGVIDLPRLAVESLIDGCLAEGVAAELAERGAALAEEPAVREFLATIARDEAAHAELAWQVVSWAVERGGGRVRRAVTLSLSRIALTPCPAATSPRALSPALLARYGQLEQEALAQVFAARAAEVIARARQLLAATPERQAA